MINETYEKKRKEFPNVKTKKFSIILTPVENIMAFD
jgi:hypothetical protein